MDDLISVRPYTPADEPDVRRIFRETVLLGCPMEFELCGFDRYERLCLGWFLTRGVADVGILDEGGKVRGYVLVCTDLRSYYRWAGVTALVWSIGTIARLAIGRLRGQDARFHRLRLLDGWLALRGGPSSPMPALVHVNLDRCVRGALAGRALTRYADERCAAAGAKGWFGEINARRGQRVGAFKAIGLDPVHHVPNRTLTWLRGQPVDRFTVVHSLDRPVGRRLAAGDLLADVIPLNSYRVANSK